jgi:2-phospho-L-lactate guanylyltransferase
MTPTVVMPIRDFEGFTRLAGLLTSPERADLAIELADSVRAAAIAAGLPVHIVSSDVAVRRWADDHDVPVVEDPGGGLDEACEAAIADMTMWLVVHADLPGLDAPTLVGLAEAAASGVVIAPSADGGTNIIGAPHPIRFRFGPGSFHRHLADHPSASIVVDPRTSIEIDTPAHVDGMPATWMPSSLGAR